jgi:hypothetical protein
MLNKRSGKQMNERKGGARRRIGPIFLAASAAGAFWTQRANCATETWTAGSANWAALANWNSGSGPVPGNGDTVDIANADNTNRTITYNYTGSAVTLSSLTVDNDGGGTDTLSMTSTGLALSATNETIGDSGSLVIGGTGVVNQSVGANTVNVNFILGFNSKDTGTYSLSGSGTLTTPDFEYVGYSGTGSFVQSSGTNTASLWLYLGYNSGSNGTYNLTGGSLIAPSMSVGYNGTGVFTQSNGSLTSTGFITVGDQAGGSGTYNLNGGILNGGALNVGYSSAVGPIPASTGTFNQTSGTATFTGLSMGQNTGALGIYSLSSSANLSISGAEDIGNSGLGTLIQTGGSHTASDGLYLGNLSGSTGAYTLSGTGSLSAPEGEYIGAAGAGTFNQTGGTNTVSSGNGFNISMGTFNSSAGMYQGGVSSTYSLSGTGSLATGSADELVGLSGPGTFSQSGGTNTTEVLLLTYDPGSSALYSLSGTGLLSASVAEVVGMGGPATFIQTGGTNKVAGTFYVAEAASGFSGSGFYSLSGAGSLFVGGSEYIGQDNVGTFSQTGGENTTNGSLYVGYNGGIGPGSGTYNISGGSVAVGSAVVVGGGGPSVLSVSGTSSLTVAGSLEINNVPNAAINLSGGTITAGGLDFNGATSLFNWTGGTLNLTTNVIWDPAAANTTTSAAFQNALTIGVNQTLMISGNETIGGAGAFSLTLNSGSTHYVTGSITLSPTGIITQNTGSTLYYSTFTQAGGTVNGTLQNQGEYIYQSGAFNGRLLNEGGISLGANFTAGNGIENDTTISLQVGQTITVNGAGLDNLGTFNLNGGMISGTGPVVNDYSGTMQAYGTINQALTNDGNLTVAGVLRLNSTIANFGVVQGNGDIIGIFSNTSGGSVDVAANDSLEINSSWTNSSLVTLGGGVLGGGTISNTGTIQGDGSVNSTINNSTGVIRADGGELDLGGAADTNASAAQIQSATGATVLVIQGLSTNSGLIALAGGTFDNNNKPMSNAGTISGDGILRTGSLTNTSTGLILLTDADSSVYGPVTNSTGGNIKIVSNTTTFYGAVTNNGTIKVTNGVANFLGNGVSMTVGGTYNSDPSDNYFNGLSTTSTGLVTGGSGDRFFLTNNSAFTNAGTFANGGTLSANAVTNSGMFTQTGTLTATGNFANSGAATIGGVQTWSLGTTFTNTAGRATFQSDAGSASAYNLSLNITGGTVALASPQHWAGLTISDGGNVDVANNHIIIAYGSSDPIATIRGYLQTGYNGGAWNGPGIDSSIAALPANSHYGIGYADGADGIVTGLSSGQIEIKYTLLGDADLDGSVTGSDFTALAGNLGKSGVGWDKGDFLYTGAVTGSDFTALVQNLGKSATGADVAIPTSDYAAIDAFAEANGLMADVPEPTATGWIVFAGIGMLLRRVRSTRC